MGLWAPDELALARQRAARTRAEALMAVRSGRWSVDDVLDAYPAERALGRITLHQLLRARPQTSEAEAKRLLKRVRWFAAHRNPHRTTPVPERPTVAWLRSGRESSSLRDSFRVALSTPRRSPWEGFPFTPAPPPVAPVADEAEGWF